MYTSVPLTFRSHSERKLSIVSKLPVIVEKVPTAQTEGEELSEVLMYHLDYLNQLVSGVPSSSSPSPSPSSTSTGSSSSEDISGSDTDNEDMHPVSDVESDEEDGEEDESTTAAKQRRQNRSKRRLLAQQRGERKLPLYFGTKDPSECLAALMNRRITHVVSCGFHTSPSLSPRFHQRSVPVVDSHTGNAYVHFEDTSKWIQDAIRNGGSVYIHAQDVSLAAAFVVAYLMRHEQLSAPQAFQIVLLARPSVALHGGVKRQISIYEHNMGHSKQRAVLMMSNML